MTATDDKRPPNSEDPAPTAADQGADTTTLTPEADVSGAAKTQLRAQLLAAAAHTKYAAGPVTPGLLLAWALAYGTAGWRVFPLRGKVPAIAGGSGCLDATVDISTICWWWGVKYRGANIGGAVPPGVCVLDNDPRKDGYAEAAAALTDRYGPLPATLTHLSGRRDGGCHRFYRHPGGRLSTKRLGPGFDIKTSGGYVVLPPSRHPDTGWSYLEILDIPIADPGWLTDLITAVPPPAPATPKPFVGSFFNRPSIADEFSTTRSWADILTPHGWRCLDADPDADGTRWLHPTHTSNCSATIRHDLLFVWSTSTLFEPSEAGNPTGYTRFRAHAILNHGGDLKAAAAALRLQRGAL